MTYPAPYTLGLYPDLMGDARTWLRIHPYLTALKADDNVTSLLAARVFFRIPDVATFPLIQLYDAGTINQPGEAPVVDGQLGLTVWGGTYKQVSDITNAVKAAFHLMPPGTRMGATTVGLNADVTGSVDSPDPDTGAPRKVLTVALTARVLTATG